MELRVEFANRMCDILGPEFYKNDAEWLQIMRDFMAGELIVVRQVEVGDGLSIWEIGS